MLNKIFKDQDLPNSQGELDSVEYGILWNLAYTYDVFLIVNKPYIFSENYVFYYKCFVYITGTLFSIIIFFPNMAFFTESSIYIWYIKRGRIYNTFVNFPIVWWFLIILYVWVKHLKESNYIGHSRDKHKVKQVIFLHRLYFTMWAIFQFSNLAFGFISDDSSRITMIHSIWMSLTPLNISIVFIWSINYIRAGEAYRIINLEDEEELKMMPVAETLLDSMMMRHLPIDLETNTKLQRKPSDNQVIVDRFRPQFSKKENIKDSLRRNVLEYIVRGFEGIYKVTKEDISGDIKNYADENNEDDANKSVLFGNLDVMKKVNLLTRSQIERLTQYEKSK